MKLQLYTNKEENEIIRKASEVAGLNISSFLRTSSILHARKLIRENEEGENATS
jgi:uncharacterized protein (DUF1778 family)